MSELSFEWDSRKKIFNIKTHKISFVETETVFLNEHAAVALDPDHSINEDRFVIIGFS